ncbi:MAG: quinol:electron acceptor oxidoreductase subunit ActD [Thermoguttaceae bacterium]
MTSVALPYEIDNTAEDPRRRAVLVAGRAAEGLHAVSAGICAVAEARRPPRAWYAAMGVAVTALAVLGLMIAYLFFTGVGVWNENRPVCWAFDITNFVFWIGIGHAGTLISAILFLFRQKWRTGINRFAEAMTIFAVMCAGLFPAIHVGRVWLVYWLFPYPNQMGMWPNFTSPLLWDVFAVSTYATVSLLFWYLGMVPDLATFRDRATSRWRFYLYGILSLGWRGSQRHWHVYEKAYLLLAALATPLVLSVHSVVSFDFAVSQLPGWHSTIFPPYFVAGAIFSGFAMVVTLAVPARELFGLKDFITRRHLDNMAKILLVTGCIVAYAYLTEFFMAWYGGSPWEQFQFLDRLLGPMGWCGWIMLTCNAVVPQVLWLKKARVSPWLLFIVSVLVNVGMWFERFVIIVGGLHRDFLPSSWGSYCPSYVEVLTLVGSFGLFLTLFLLFCRYLPMVAMAEVKSILPRAEGGRRKAEGGGLSPSTEDGGPLVQTSARWGLLAEYPDPDALRAAARQVCQAGYRRWDCYCPFAVHGLDRAMGIRPTILPWLVLGGGLTGCLAAVGLQWYCNAPRTAIAAIGGLSGFPLIISGKPYWSLPANIPVAFELTVLLAALACFFGLWALVRLPRPCFPAFASPRFRKVTDDGFFIIIEAKDKSFDRQATGQLLASTDCLAIEEID